MKRSVGTSIAALVAVTLACPAFAGEEPTAEEFKAVSDPFEPVNRVIYRFNEVADDYVVEPAARGYDRVIPGPVKTGVSNFFDNLSYPVVIVSDLLQGRFVQSGADTARFAVNTTIGVVGLFDVAKHLDLPSHDEDFGQAAGRWGVGEGPYLVLPLLGASNIRDTVGRLVSGALIDPPYRIEDSGARYALLLLKGLDARYKALEAGEVLDEAALDPYAFVRESYSQNRRTAITE